MTPYDLGTALRHQVLQDQRLGRPLDGRRLVAILQDLCGENLKDLLPALRHLLLCAPFQASLQQRPPLADARLQPLLQAELEPIFAAPLCRRMEGVIAGLLGVPASAPPRAPQAEAMPTPPVRPASSAAPAPTAMAPPAATVSPAALVPPAATVSPAALVSPAAVPTSPGRFEVPRPPAPLASANPPAHRPSAAVPMLLGLIAGILLMGLTGLALLVWWQRPLTLTGSSQPATKGSAEPAPTATAETPSPSPEPSTPIPTAPAPPSSDPAAAAGQAIATVEEVYGALSQQDYSRAQQLFSGAAADQFSPEFFRQFQRVSVQDLRVTGQSGSSVNLEGVVAFTYRDGATQTETRTFTVDMAGPQPTISASEFGRVLQARP